MQVYSRNRACLSWVWHAAALTLLCNLVACSGSSEKDAAAAGGAGGAAQAAQGGASASAGMPSSQPCIDTPCPDSGPRPLPLPPPKCPVSEPKAGDACSDTTLYCSYGDSPAANCRHAYQCTNGAAGPSFVADPAVAQAGPCVTVTAESCPATPMPRTRCDMTPLTTACQYPGLVCQCRLSSRGLASWQCLGAPENPSCPQDLPNVGVGCASNGLECDYAADSCDPTPNRTLFCYEGAWEPGQALGCAL